jgi:hypothetical protein
MPWVLVCVQRQVEERAAYGRERGRQCGAVHFRVAISVVVLCCQRVINQRSPTSCAAVNPSPQHKHPAARVLPPVEALYLSAPSSNPPAEAG